jgi:hypothetical protein
MTHIAHARKLLSTADFLEASPDADPGLTIAELRAILTALDAAEAKLHAATPHVVALNEWCSIEGQVGLGAYLDDLCRLLDILDPKGKAKVATIKNGRVVEGDYLEIDADGNAVDAEGKIIFAAGEAFPKEDGS